MKGRVLVTGASGFIGKRLTTALAKEGWEVRAAARDPSAIPAANGVERVAMSDLAQSADWPALLQGVTHVAHLAGIAHAPGTLPDAQYSRINAESVGEFAEAARGKLKRFVFLSSVRAQAGLSAERPITETDVPAPTDAYGRAKLEGERLLARKRRSLHRAPSRRGLRQRGRRQYRGSCHARADTHAASPSPA